MGRHHKQAADMPHLGLRFRSRTHHEARCVHQADDGQAVRIAQLHETRGLVGCIGVDGAAKMRRVVGQQPHRAPLDARQCRVNPDTERGAQGQQAATVHQAVHGRAGVVNAQAIFGHHRTQGHRVGRLPARHRALKK